MVNKLKIKQIQLNSGSDRPTIKRIKLLGGLT
jgi:hypothetical protein